MWDISSQKWGEDKNAWVHKWRCSAWRFRTLAENTCDFTAIGNCFQERFQVRCGIDSIQIRDILHMLVKHFETSQNWAFFLNGDLTEKTIFSCPSPHQSQNVVHFATDRFCISNSLVRTV